MRSNPMRCYKCGAYIVPGVRFCSNCGALASDPESEYFCAGITEDILTDLTKIRGMRVASRNAACG